MSTTGSEYRIDLQNVRDMDAFVRAFNVGLIDAIGGHWHGNSWDVFNDHLSWSPEESYSLILDGWASCRALGDRDLAVFEEVLAAHPHVSVRRT